jgi:deaminated glutathione amidase
LSTIYRKLGADILTYPSAFTVPTGLVHWEVLLRARAIENQCYVIAAAQVGQHHEKRESYGHGMVVDPWGKVLVDLGDKVSCYQIVDIDTEKQCEIRSSIPIMESARDDMYLQVPIMKSDSTFFFKKRKQQQSY